MKRINILMASLLATVLCSAQMLNVKVDCVNYLFPATTIGDMTFSEGRTRTIKDKVFTLGEVSLMTTQAATDNTVTVDYASAVPVVSVADLQYHTRNQRHIAQGRRVLTANIPTDSLQKRTGYWEPDTCQRT